MKVWKLGCNWGSNTPNFFPLLAKLGIVITVPQRPFNVGDLVILAEGHRVSGIAKPNDPLAPITDKPEWRSEFENYEIPFDDNLLYSHAELYTLEDQEKFDYKLQQGIIQVQKEEIKQLSIELWDRYSHSKLSVDTESKHQVNQPLNQILYGPPGTGKTYQTKSLAVEILDGNAPENRAGIRERYGELYKEGRIKFITFHQGTTYEDFIEGIKPALGNKKEGSEEENNDLNYIIEDGIFKQMCIEASYEYAKRQSQEQSSSKSLNFSQLYDRLVSTFVEQLDGNEVVRIPQKSGQKIDVVEISSKGNIIVRHQQGQRTYTVSKDSLRKIYNTIEDLSGISNVYTSFREITGIVNASAYWAVLNQIYQLQDKSDHSEFEGSELSHEGKRSVFQDIEWSEIETDQDVPKYLLIIDEINRGNIAAVLGELITLLEPDKRGGTNESIEVTLPYSKTNFAVPPNLYVLGTMNTADRSVEALDTALRRRFSFTEVGPNPTLLKDIVLEYPNGNPLNLGDLLSVINYRIARLIDRDHMIGHAYFMGIATAPDPWQALQDVFHRNLLPLLQEYFFGDPGKIGLVLGGGFVKAEEDEASFGFAAFEHAAADDFSERKLLRIEDVSGLEMEDFQQAVRNILPESNTGKND